MNIGVFVTGIGVPVGRERNVSGHMQLALHTCRMLLDEQHTVHLITNRYHDDYVLPAAVPSSDRFSLHLVSDGRVRGRIGLQQHHLARYKPFAVFAHIWEIRQLVRRHRLDVLHLFGFERVAALGGVLRMLTGVPAVVTLHAAPRNPVLAALARRVDSVMTSTDFVAQQSRHAGLAPTVLRPGVVRDLRREIEEEPTRTPWRVVFWREATREAGADLVSAAFDRLAPRYPRFSFDLVLRQNRFEVEGLADLERRHDNVHVHRFPYAPGGGLGTLLSQAVCVVLPFRRLTIHPQAAVAESLLAGVATITTDLGSSPELVRHGETGLLVPVDSVDAVVAAIERMLSDVDHSIAMGRAARETTLARWNWDAYRDDMLAEYQRHAVGRATPGKRRLAGAEA